MTLAETRRSWHGVAELLLAGPQHARTGTIRLRATPGGLGTIAEPALRIEGTRLVHARGAVELDGRTPVDVAEEAGVVVASLDDVYSDGSGVLASDVLRVDADSAQVLAAAFEAGDGALRWFLSDRGVDDQPVLWPEHFDIAVALDEVNYGVSPGDASAASPYAYVGPWAPRRGTFWTESFGAACPLAELGGVDGIHAFFSEGREAAARDPQA
jgi:hypothetical protein